MKYIISFICLSFLSCTEPETNDKIAPATDLAHIDIILDSATWAAIRSDSFMQTQFAVMNNDTAVYSGKKSYDIYLLGQLNFLHLSQAKDFWHNRAGGGALVFQSQKPDSKDSLLASWKHFYSDSLEMITYHGSDFTLYEIIAAYDSTKPKKPEMFADLTSYSADAYKNWGITDSIINEGVALKQFMSDWGGKELENKLFNSITELYITINQKEFTEIRSALLATGYKEENNKFSHRNNPTVFITTTEEKEESKYSKIKFSLTHSVETKEIVFSPFLTLKLNGGEAEFLIN
jgi:hypothetical protein